MALCLDEGTTQETLDLFEKGFKVGYIRIGILTMDYDRGSFNATIRIYQSKDYREIDPQKAYSEIINCQVSENDILRMKSYDARNIVYDYIVADRWYKKLKEKPEQDFFSESNKETDEEGNTIFIKTLDEIKETYQLLFESKVNSELDYPFSIV